MKYCVCVCVCVCVHACVCAYVCVSCSVTSNSLQPHGQQPSTLLCPWNSPGKSTGVGSHFLLQGIFLTQWSTWVSCRSLAGREAQSVLQIQIVLLIRREVIVEMSSQHPYYFRIVWETKNKHWERSRDKWQFNATVQRRWQSSSDKNR